MLNVKDKIIEWFEANNLAIFDATPTGTFPKEEGIIIFTGSQGKQFCQEAEGYLWLCYETSELYDLLELANWRNSFSSFLEGLGVTFELCNSWSLNIYTE